MNSRLTCKTGIGNLKDKNGNIVVDNQTKANILNEFFASVGVADNGIDVDLKREVPENVSLDSVTFDPAVILRTIRRLKNKHSSDPSGYNVILLKRLAECLSYPLSLLFNSLMSTGSVPAVWKTAVVTPVYKSGLSSEPSNCRPISLTSVFCKLLERIIVTEMLQYSKKHGLISSQQHGFLSKRSTATNLLESLDDWTCAFVNRNSAFIAYIDFKKAFDSVCHKKTFA